MHISLRKLAASDDELLWGWRTSPFVAANMLTEVSDRQSHDAWFAQALSRRDAIYRVIEADGEAVGLTYATGLGGELRRGLLGYYVGESGWRGRGVATRALLAFIDELVPVVVGLDAAVLPENKASLAVLARLGFERTGVEAGVIHVSLEMSSWLGVRARLLDTLAE